MQRQPSSFLHHFALTLGWDRLQERLCPGPPLQGAEHLTILILTHYWEPGPELLALPAAPRRTERQKAYPPLTLRPRLAPGRSFCESGGSDGQRQAVDGGYRVVGG